MANTLDPIQLFLIEVLSFRPKFLKDGQKLTSDSAPHHSFSPFSSSRVCVSHHATQEEKAKNTEEKYSVIFMVFQHTTGNLAYIFFSFLIEEICFIFVPSWLLFAVVNISYNNMNDVFLLLFSSF